MDLEPTELQVDLTAAVRRLCEGRFPMEIVRAHMESGLLDRSRWRELAEAGVFSLCLSEAEGGTGLGMADAGVVFQELGRALVPGPLVATHLAAGIVEGAATGDTIVGILETGPGAGRRVGTGGHIPSLVEHLDSIDVLLMLGPDGVTRIDARSVKGRKIERPLDASTPLTELDAAPAGTVVGDASMARDLRRSGACLTAALLVGVAHAATTLAVGYAKQREQFGRPIGSFQAVKHLLADMLARAEVARAAVDAAAAVIDHPEVGDVDRAVSSAKVLAADAALLNGKSGIQVHGGMGFTWEVDAQLYLKRAWVLETHFGSVDDHAELLATLVR
jgi:alkylation response protein AidB-like acyl-CoA dehydrogenase